MFASTCLHCLDAASIGIGLANFGGVSMLFSVSAGDDPDPLCGDRDRRSAADGSAVLLFAGEP